MKETLQSIIAWHVETFPDATLSGQIEKLKDEWKEWDESDNDISELADVFIVCAGLARFGDLEYIKQFANIDAEMNFAEFSDIDLMKAIDAKMEINRAREWKKQGGKY